jgi:glycosyltransferase involved in cell wall biosynthesis
MDSHPLVSICIPTYNRAGMIGKAIESALAQSYPHLEVIVVDNASTDDTESIVRQFADSRMVYYRNDENLGLFGNFNRCLEFAKGDIIHILHSDDFIDPDFTRTCVQFFVAHPSVMLTFSAASILAGDKESDISYSDKDEIFIAPEGFCRVLSERSFIVCPSIMIRRPVYDRFGRYSLEYPYSSDLDYWLRISRSCDIGFVCGARLYYRQGDHSESYIHLFTSVTGYLDTLKIYANTIRSLEEERRTYNAELTLALYRFIGDCIYAGFTRANSMKGFTPGFFTGTSLCAWSMIQPASLAQSLKKWTILPALVVAGFIMAIPFIRRIAGRQLVNGRMDY